MRLTAHSDYALRLLMYLATCQNGRATVGEIAKAYKVSRNHMVKVANGLARLGFIEASRGRGGGLKLARAPGRIVVGDVIRKTEPDFALAACMAPGGSCPIMGACALEGTLGRAMAAFLATLDSCTLADFAREPGRLQGRLRARRGGRRSAGRARP